MTMKKLLIFLFLAIAGICETKAQYTIADNNHMTYRGVSLGLDISDFAKQLNAKGVSFGDEGFYDSGEFTDGSFEFQTLDVAYDQYEKRLKNVGVYWFYRLREEAEPFVASIYADIQRSYPNAQFDYMICKNEYGSREERYCCRILSEDKQTLKGSVVVVLNIDDNDPHYSASVKYYDTYNSMMVDGLKYGIYDLSDMMSPYYDSCYLFLDEDCVIINPKKDNVAGMLMARGADREYVLETLFRNDCTKEEKGSQLYGHLAGLPLFDKNYICTTSFCLNDSDIYWGMPSNQYADAPSMAADNLFGESSFKSMLGSKLKGTYAGNQELRKMFSVFR